MAGNLMRFITQKIKHPRTRDWIETMYMTDDGAGNDIKIYWHGAPADDNVINFNHLSNEAVSTIQQGTTQALDLGNIPGKIKSSQIEDDAILTNHILNGQVNTVDLAPDAVTTAKIEGGAVTKEKLDTNLKTALNATVTDGTLNLPNLT